MASYLLITIEQTMQKQTHFTSYAITEKNHWPFSMKLQYEMCQVEILLLPQTY